MRSQIESVRRDVDKGVAYQPHIEFLQRQNEKMAEAERLVREEAPRDRGDRNSYAEAERLAREVSANLLRGRER